MYVLTILVICYYNGKILRAETDVKYVENKVVIVPFDVQVDCTFEQLGDMIYSMTDIDKQRFKLVISCKYPLKCGNRFQPCLIWDDSSVYRILKLVNTTSMEEIELYIEVVRVKLRVHQSMGAYTNLLVRGNDNIAELDYDCGPSSAPTPDTDRCEVYGYDEDYEDEDSDDESNGNIDVQVYGHLSSFHTLNQVLENETRIYVSMDVATCDVSNNSYAEDLDEHVTPSPQFKNVENLDNVISSDWTPWVHKHCNSRL